MGTNIWVESAWRSSRRIGSSRSRWAWQRNSDAVQPAPAPRAFSSVASASRYLVVVARGGDAPDLATLAAFVVEGPQAITYLPGTWHHPMVALDHDADFVNVIFADGTADDCHEVSLDPAPATITIPR